MRTTTKSDVIGKGGGGGEDCVCMEYDAIHRSKLAWEVVCCEECNIPDPRSYGNRE